MALTINWSIESDSVDGGDILTPVALLADVQAHDSVNIEVSSRFGRVWLLPPVIDIHRIPLSRLGFEDVGQVSEITGLKYRSVGSPRQDVSFGGSTAIVNVPVFEMQFLKLEPAVSGGTSPQTTPALTVDQIVYVEPEYFPEVQPEPFTTFRSLIILKTISGGSGPTISASTLMRWTNDDPALTTPTWHHCDLVPFEEDETGSGQPTDQAQFRRRMTNPADEYTGVGAFNPEARTDFSVEYHNSPTLGRLWLSVRNSAIDVWSPPTRAPVQPSPEIISVAPTVNGTLPNVTYNQNSGNQTVNASTVFVGEDIVYSLNPAAISNGFTIDSSTGVVTIPTVNTLVDARVIVSATNPGGSAFTSFLVNITAVAIPVSAVGTIANRNFNQGSGTQTIDVSGAFTGTPPITYSLTTAPAGVTLSGNTISVVTTNVLAQSDVVVKATNSANPTGVTQTFKVAVLEVVNTGVPLWRQLPDFSTDQFNATPSHPDISSTGSIVVGGDLQLHVSAADRRADKPHSILIGGDMNGLWEFDVRLASGRGIRICPPAMGLQAYALMSIMRDVDNSDWVYILGSVKYDTAQDTGPASGLYQSKDGGKTFKNILQIDQVIAETRYVANFMTCWPLNDTGSASTRTIKVMCPIQRENAALQDIKLFELQNGGATSTSKGTLAIANFQKVRALIQHPTNRDELFICSDKGLWRTTNWNAATPSWARPAWPFNNANVTVSDIWIDPTNANRMIVAVADTAGERGLWWTVNGGGAWTRERSGDNVGTFGVGQPLADGTGRQIVIHLLNDEVGKPIVSKFKTDNTGFTAFSVCTRTLPQGVSAGPSTLDNLTGKRANNVYSQSCVLPHPTDPLEFVIYGVRRLWRSTNGGSSFHLVNGLGLGFNARDVEFSADPADWDVIAWAVADVSVGVSTQRGRIINKNRWGAAPGFQSGFSCTILPDDAAVPVSRRGAVIAGVGNFTGSLGAFKDGTWTSLRGGTEQYGCVDYNPFAPNWVAAGARRSNNAFTGHDVVLGNQCHAVRWSRKTDGLLWGISSNGDNIMYSTDSGASFSTYVNTGIDQNRSRPTIWPSMHTDNRVFATENIGGRKEFCLYKGAPGSTPTKVSMRVFNSLPFAPEQWAPRDLAEDPFDPTIVYGVFRTFGVPWVWKFKFNSGFSAVTIEDITRNLPYGTHQLTFGVNPHTAEPVLSTVFGLWVLSAPEGHRTTFNITNALYDTAAKVPTNGWETLVGGVSQAPTRVGTPPDVTYTQNSGTKIVPLANFFDGHGLTLTYSLTANPSGVTINATTGEVSIPTTSLLTEQLITVRATNAVGNISQSFRVTVQTTSQAPVWATIPDVTYDQNTGEQSYNVSQFVSGSTPITFSLTASPAGVTINATTGVISIPTTNALSAVLTTVRAENSAGNASRSFDITVREQTSGGTLPNFPAAALTTALGRPNIAYSDSFAGVTTGGNSTHSAFVAAYAAHVGQTSADNKVKSQMRSWLSGSGPSAQGGVSAQHDLAAAGTIALARLTPRIWNSFSAAERNGFEALIEAIGVMGAAIESNTYATPSKTLLGGPSNRSGNPNISNAYPANLAMLRVFKGSNAATTTFLDGLDCDNLRSRLNTAGISNAVKTYGTSRPAGAPTLTQIQNACDNWRSFSATSLGVSDLFNGILRAEIERTCNKPAWSGYGGNAGNNWVGSGVGGTGRGRMINNNNAATIAPVAGQIGMSAELDSADAEGVRVACHYAMWSLRNITIWTIVGLCAGLITKNATMNTVMDKFDVGWRTLEIHSDNGFYDYSHGGGSGSVNWTSANHSVQWGWPYAFPMWFSIAKPIYDDL